MAVFVGVYTPPFLTGMDSPVSDSKTPASAGVSWCLHTWYNNYKKEKKMADLNGKYVVHPSGSTTAAQLAALYGLTGGEYIDGTSGYVASQTWHLYIHLYVREDEKYRNIKTLLGDNGTEFIDDLAPRRIDQPRRRFNEQY